MITFSNYISKHFPNLKINLENTLGNVTRELLNEAAKEYATQVANEKIEKYNSVMNDQE
jgi:hypothetical protein